jgi:predicted PurR-regulated permease PerM
MVTKLRFPLSGELGTFGDVEEQSSFPSEFQKRTMWRALTGVAIMILGILLVGLIWLTSSVLGYLQPVFVPLAVAGIVAYLLDPVVRWLQKRGLSRMKGIIAVFSGFVVFFVILALFVGNKLSGQIESAFGENTGSPFPSLTTEKLESQKEGYWGWMAKKFFEKNHEVTQNHLKNGGALVGPNKTKWRLSEDGKSWQSNGESPSAELTNFFRSDWSDSTKIDGVENAENLIALENFRLTKGGSFFTSLGGRLLSWLSDSTGKILGFFGVILGLVMVPIYLYYFLKEGESIKNNWQAYVPLKASAFKTDVVETLQEINGYLISFFRGQVLVAFIDGILVGLALTIFGLDYGLLIGLCMAMLGIIPYIGNVLCLVPACFIAANQGANGGLWGLPVWGAVLAVVLIFVVVQQINSLVTAPKIVGDSVGLHPMTVIFSMLFWSLLLGGLLGALLAVPLTAAVKVLFKRYIWDRPPSDDDEEGGSVISMIRSSNSGRKKA